MTDWNQQNQLDRLYRRTLMLVGPVKILATDDSGPIHLVQGNLNGGPEIVDRLPVMQHYGISTHAPVGSDAAAIFIAGLRSNGFIVGTNNQQARVRNLKPGEVSVYTDEGDSLHFAREQAATLTAGNSFTATTKAATIKGTNTVTLDSPVSSVTDKLVLAHDPEAPMEACTKQYADALAVGGGGGPGPPGPAGPPGAAATIAVGITTTGTPGTPAIVTNTGTPSAAVFDFTIPAGVAGATGAQGPQGPVGNTGPAGAIGATGPQGNPGPAGATGPQGPIGLTGSTGPQGPIGNTGATGPQGPIGNTGPAGSTGAPGAAGAAATIAVGTTTTGAAGSSATVTNSGSSSAAVFNFTIPQGIQGATGAQGPIGNTGATGPQGPIGLTGPAGPQGPIGNTGAQGPAGPGTITGVTAGTGLTGGGSTGAVTLSLSTPVAIPNGGTNATTAAAALSNLGGAPLASPTFTGTVTIPTLTLGGNLTSGASGGAFVISGSPTITGSLFTVSNQAGDSGFAGGSIVCGHGRIVSLHASNPSVCVYVTGSFAWTMALNPAASSTYLLWGTSDGYGNPSSSLMWLGTQGNLTITGAFTQGSDRRLKTNIMPWSDGGLAAILALRPRSFQRLVDGKPDGLHHVGLIADEVEEVIPDAVHELPIADEGLLGIELMPLICALINATQELGARVSHLEVAA